LKGPEKALKRPFKKPSNWLLKAPQKALKRPSQAPHPEKASYKMPLNRLLKTLTRP
jgi:hypothetical protein